MKNELRKRLAALTEGFSSDSDGDPNVTSPYILSGLSYALECLKAANNGSSFEGQAGSDRVLKLVKTRLLPKVKEPALKSEVQRLVSALEDTVEWETLNKDTEAQVKNARAQCISAYKKVAPKMDELARKIDPDRKSHDVQADWYSEAYS